MKTVEAELLAALAECKTHNNANCIVTNDVAYMIRRFKSINKIVDDAIAKATNDCDAGLADPEAVVEFLDRWGSSVR